MISALSRPDLLFAAKLLLEKIHHGLHGDVKIAARELVVVKGTRNDLGDFRRKVL